MSAVIVRPFVIEVVASVFMYALRRKADCAGSPKFALMLGVPRRITQLESDPLPKVSSRIVVGPPPLLPPPVEMLHATAPAPTTNAPANIVTARIGPPRRASMHVSPASMRAASLGVTA